MGTKPTYQELENRLKQSEKAFREGEEQTRLFYESENEKNYRAVIENSLTGIYIDQNGQIVFANKKFADIYKYAREELIGMPSWKLVHPEDRELTNRIRAERLKGYDIPLEYEAKGLTKDGDTIWILRGNTLIDHRGRPAILGNIADITQQKLVEEELRMINEELRDFVQVVTHDLRNPLLPFRVHLPGL